MQCPHSMHQQQRSVDVVVVEAGSWDAYLVPTTIVEERATIAMSVPVLAAPHAISGPGIASQMRRQIAELT